MVPASASGRDEAFKSGRELTSRTQSLRKGDAMRSVMIIFS